MRKENDERRELTEDKDTQIQLLQNNLNTLSTELEILKEFRPKQSFEISIKRKDKGGSERLTTEECETPQWVKDHMVIPEKQIIKPIRGGMRECF